MSHNDESDKTIVLGCFAIVLLIPVNILLKGYVISQLWLWLVVPFGLPAISLAHSYGLLILAGLIYPGCLGVNPKFSNDQSMVSLVFLMFCYSVVTPLLALLFGWLCHICM